MCVCLCVCLQTFWMSLYCRPYLTLCSNVISRNVHSKRTVYLKIVLFAILLETLFQCQLDGTKIEIKRLSRNKVPVRASLFCLQSRSEAKFPAQLELDRIDQSRAAQVLCSMKMGKNSFCKDATIITFSFK